MDFYIKYKVTDIGIIEVLGTLTVAPRLMVGKRQNESVLKTNNLQETLNGFEKHNNLLLNIKPEVLELSNNTESLPITKPSEQQRRNPVKWDWTKVSEEDKDQIKKWYRKSEWKKIMKYHNENKLSDSRYCCGGHVKLIKSAIENYLQI